MNTNLHRILALLVAVGATSCTTSRWYDTRYQPAPLETRVTANAVAGSQVRALVSVLGVARASEEEGHGDQVEMRLLLENLGTVEAQGFGWRPSLSANVSPNIKRSR